uniref:aldehyde dehydrogenase family protein n=1 Tax=Pseudomonas sp. MD330_10 TaxID=3241254 RepID=UPI0036D3AD87
MSQAKRFEKYINGQWEAAADYCTKINPSEFSDVIGEYAKADVAQVNAAFDAARAAFPAWTTSGLQARHD